MVLTEIEPSSHKRCLIDVITHIIKSILYPEIFPEIFNPKKTEVKAYQCFSEESNTSCQSEIENKEQRSCDDGFWTMDETGKLHQAGLSTLGNCYSPPRKKLKMVSNFVAQELELQHVSNKYRSKYLNRREYFSISDSSTKIIERRNSIKSDAVFSTPKRRLPMRKLNRTKSCDCRLTGYYSDKRHNLSIKRHIDRIRSVHTEENNCSYSPSRNKRWCI
uniref:Rho-GAP domain-containing protein n=1 Tax=Syphacia muris TaxID=451379 RepID=A0A0N5AH32_9BILA